MLAALTPGRAWIDVPFAVKGRLANLATFTVPIHGQTNAQRDEDLRIATRVLRS